MFLHYGFALNGFEITEEQKKKCVYKSSDVIRKYNRNFIPQHKESLYKLKVNSLMDYSNIFKLL